MVFEMNILWAVVFLLGGLTLLWKSADILVAGAVGIAEHLGVSPLVVGLTVVAMGTSAPEVAASIAATVRGTGDIALGNVYGSNIANLALVGGVAALIRPTIVQLSTLKREMPIMLAVVLLLWPILHNLGISRSEGVILLVIFTAFIALMIAIARKANGDRKKFEVIDEVTAVAIGAKSVPLLVLMVLGGLAGLALGAEITVRGAVFIGQKVGLSDAVIGLTIIAVGTSLPELMTCIVASVKGHHDISIGNLVGSNIFNTLLVPAAAALVKPITISQRLIGNDYYAMIAVSIVFITLAAVGKRISRFDGVILLAIYIGYMTFLFLGG